MLPSKTVPEVNNGKKQRCILKPKAKASTAAPSKKKARASSVTSVEVEEIEDEDSAPTISPTGSFQIPGTKRVSLSVYYNGDVFI